MPTPLIPLAEQLLQITHGPSAKLGSARTIVGVIGNREGSVKEDLFQILIKLQAGGHKADWQQ